MAVRTPIPISQPLAPGLLQVDYSPWSTGAGSRTGLEGLPGFLSYTGSTGITGSTPDKLPAWSTDFISTKEPGGPETIGAGLPMPDVEGYKYVYPKWDWHHEGGWEEKGWEEDRDAYDYYPYWPTDIATHKGPILVGVKLIKE